MSKTDGKNLIIYLRASETTTKWKEDYTNELTRLISEMLPLVNVNRSGNRIEIETPNKFSKRILKLRIKKFLHQKKLKEDFRVVSYNTTEIEGYQIIERKIVELSYY
jgi:hypothetical protein